MRACVNGVCVRAYVRACMCVSVSVCVCACACVVCACVWSQHRDGPSSHT